MNLSMSEAEIWKIKRHFVGVWATCHVRVVVSGLNQKKTGLKTEQKNETIPWSRTWVSYRRTDVTDHSHDSSRASRPIRALRSRALQMKQVNKKKVMSAHFFLEFVTRTSIWSRLLILFSPNQSVRWKKERAKIKKIRVIFFSEDEQLKQEMTKKRGHRFSIILWRIK